MTRLPRRQCAEAPCGRIGKIHREPTIAQVTPKLLAKQHLNIRLVIDDQNKQVQVRSPDLFEDAARAAER